MTQTQTSIDLEPAAPVRRGSDRLIWALAAAGVIVALVSPLVGGVVLLAAVVTAWVRPTGHRTRIALTAAVALLAIAVLAGWDFHTVIPEPSTGITSGTAPDPAPGN